MSNTNTKQTLSVSLPSQMIRWLEAATKAHSLPTQSKAVRCCINCVALGDIDMSTTTADDESCDAVVDQAVTIELASEQIQWIESMILAGTGERDSLKNTTTTTATPTTTFSNQSEVIRGVILACMKADEAVVFGVIRCKSKVLACEGAQEAVDLVRKRYGENNNVNVKEKIQLVGRSS